MHSLVRLVQETIFPAPSTDRLFNFYRDVDPVLDLPNAPEIRRRNLLAYLEVVPDRPEVLLLAEAPGPHGCRYSGVPITSEDQLESDLLPFSGTRSSSAEKPWKEYSANIVWGLLAPHFRRVMLWNTVPLHPHKPGKAMSIRTPTAREVDEWGSLIPQIVDMVQPSRVLSVGRVAERVCNRFDIPTTYVRHPSQGGANLFREGVSRALGLD